LMYEIRVQLKAIDPPIWRVLRVPSRTSLARLHRILQRAMGWKGYHIYLYEVDGKRYGAPSPDWGIDVLDARKMTLEMVFLAGRKSFFYDYDMGDGWRHDITLLRTVEEEEEEEELGCLAGSRACPPEDCGGPPGYYRLLVALSDPDDEEHDSMVDWVGSKYDANAFDAAAVDRALKRLR
jgi:hypothetical protein